MNNENEPLSYKRVRRRLDIVIEAIELELKFKINREKLLKDIHEDLREIRAALDFLQQAG